MKKTLHILLFIPLLALGQVQEFTYNSLFEKQVFSSLSDSQDLKTELALFFAIDSTATESVFNANYNELMAFNKARKLNKNVHRLFYETQSTYLINFVQHVAFPKIFSDSAFNCVSGSALLAFLLDYNGFSYSIEEMPYHVFVTAVNKRRKFILESTDSQYGYLPDNRQNRRIYRPDTIDNSAIFKEIGEYSKLQNGEIIVKGTVTLRELAGLNYYNDAVNLINRGKFVKAVHQLQKAYFLYPSQRVNEVTKYVLLQLLDNPNLSKEQKLPYYQMLMAHTYSYSLSK
ncbi:hypothetical protein GC194_11250 [bacterium]|nr:hypothetical protein [bacterium]